MWKFDRFTNRFTLVMGILTATVERYTGGYFVLSVYHKSDEMMFGQKKLKGEYAHGEAQALNRARDIIADAFLTLHAG
jgi:hypothetical protein